MPYIFLFAIVVVLVCYQCPMLYELWICKGWSYTPNSSLVDEQIDLIKIQEIIKKGGIAKRHEASPEDEFEYNWLEAKKEQMESRRQVMRELRDGFSIETFQAAHDQIENDKAWTNQGARCGLLHQDDEQIQNTHLQRIYHSALEWACIGQSSGRRATLVYPNLSSTDGNALGGGELPRLLSL